MHGDRVTARIEAVQSERLGRVLEVLSRRHQLLVGRLEGNRAGRPFVCVRHKVLRRADHESIPRPAVSARGWWWT